MCEITREEFEDLKKAIRENSRTLRGSNGNPGLVTDVKVMSGQVQSIEKDVSWMRTHMENGSKKENVTWKWIVDKLIAPIIAAGTVGLVMWAISSNLR